MCYDKHVKPGQQPAPVIRHSPPGMPYGFVRFFFFFFFLLPPPRFPDDNCACVSEAQEHFWKKKFSREKNL